MTTGVQEFQTLIHRYKGALKEYIGGAGEAGLQQAYELGRQAMAEGFGALDLARIHQEALADFMAERGSGRVEASTIEAALLFFTEGLAAFEMTHRGFQEAIATLSTRTAELEVLNRSLGEEIAERVRIEEALRDSESRYRTLVDKARDVIYTLEPDGTITSLNPAFEQLTGWTREEWIGKSFVGLVHPEDLQRSINYLQSQRQGITPPAFEVRVRTKSNDYLIGEFTTTPLFQEGKVVRVLGIGRDITARRKAEEELRKSELQLAEAQEIARLGNWEWDIAGGTLAWSRELYAIYGVDPSDFTPTFDSYVRLIHPADREHSRTMIEQAIKNGKPFSFHHRIIRPDGAVRVIHGRGIVAVNNQGKAVRMFGTSQDVTEAKLAEEALRQLPNRILEAQEVERRRLSRELHDDVSQRLSAMKLTIDLLEMSVPRQKGVLKKFKFAKAQIDSVIGDVRRISWNLRPPILDDLGLAVALQRLCKELHQMHKIPIRLKTSKDIPQHLDTHTEIALYRIAQESLANAIKHSKGSRVSVELKSGERGISLTVSDNGKGFDPSKEQRKRVGHGLGLVSMKERVSLLRGELEIDTAPSKGTRIKVTVPSTNNHADKKT